MKKNYLYLLICILFNQIVLSQDIINDNDVRFSYFIEGITNPEDLIDVIGQDWVIACSMKSKINTGKI